MYVCMYVSFLTNTNKLHVDNDRLFVESANGFIIFLSCKEKHNEGLRRNNSQWCSFSSLDSDIVVGNSSLAEQVEVR